MTNNFKQYRNKDTGEIIKAKRILPKNSWNGFEMYDVLYSDFNSSVPIIATKFSQQYELIENDNDK